MRQHRVEIHCEKNLYVKINPQLLQQVIFNLVNNACQAMTEPGHIRISSYSSDTKHLFSVSDTGPGIAEENLSKIFEAFYTTKKAGSGTGLGLSMSRNIIEKAGGCISVRSELGVGSEFIIEFKKENM